MPRLTRRKSRSSPLGLIVLLSALVWLFVVPAVKARFFRAPHVLAVGAGWGRGYVVIPQRPDASGGRRDRDRAALLSRQEGLAIVADGTAGDVSVIQKHGGKK